MIQRHWRWEDNRPLPFFQASRDVLPDDDGPSEEAALRRLQAAGETYNKLLARVYAEGLPDLHPENFKRDGDFPYWHMATMHKEAGIHHVPVAEIIGTGWANLPPIESPGYPKSRKFWDLLAGYLGLDQEDGIPRPIEPIEVYRVMGVYLHGEGNHRLYVARLLGLETVRAKIWDVDYEALLRRARLFPDGPHLGLRQPSGSYTLHAVTLAELDRLKALMAEAQ